MGKLTMAIAPALLAVTAAGVHPEAHAQEGVLQDLYVGIGGGFQGTHMSVSELDGNMFPGNKMHGTGVFDVFVQYEFGSRRQFGIRLEMDLLKRGGTLDRIGSRETLEDLGNLYETAGIKDVTYRLRSSYLDLRLPLIYQWGNARSKVRPYIYAAPMVCFSTGGNINARADMIDGTYVGCELPITDGNMRQTYWGGALGAGLKYDLDLGGYPVYVALEANWQMGFTNTYSAKETDGRAVVKEGWFLNVYDITGSRKFNGIEVKASVSVPLSIFKRSKTAPKPVVAEEPAWVPTPAPAAVEVKADAAPAKIPCKSIDEITQMLAEGKSISGVTFCAIDDIRFETGKSIIDPSSHKYLDEVAAILKRTGAGIEVQGHTDNTGNPQLNLNLSRDRAKAVVSYLQSRGVPKELLPYTYYGETQPIADNDTPQGRSINRRVEFVIK